MKSVTFIKKTTQMVTVFQKEVLKKQNTWGIIKNQIHIPTTIILDGKITQIQMESVTAVF
jgi:hypothetical protein